VLALGRLTVLAPGRLTVLAPGRLTVLAPGSSEGRLEAVTSAGAAAV
jgi:hypothetical protein